MAELAIFAPAAIKGVTKIVGGIGKRKAAKREAAQYERRAGEARATSQREAIEERRQARLASSRALAVAAAGGGGASDPTVINRMADLNAEGEYNAMAAMYEGYSQAEEYTERAKEARRAGKRALVSSVISGVGGLAATTLAQKYG